MTPDPRRRLVFIHSSDELYGADRILLAVVEALSSEERARTEVWLPTDLPHPAHPLCRELQGCDVVVRHLDLPVLRRAYRTPRSLPALALRMLRLGRCLRRARPGLVYCATSAVIPVAPLARLLGVRRVIGHVQEIWSRSDALILGPLARACDTLVAISTPAGNSISPRLGTKVTVVPNSTGEPGAYRPLVGREGPLTYLVASRWNAWKGHQTLMSAWELAGCPGRLVVLGGPPASGESAAVAKLAAGVSNPSSVKLVGEVTEIAPHLTAADVIIVPSDRPEPFGLVAAEAFACGRPVIASAGGGLLDIVTDGYDGWLFPLRDAQALAGILTRLDRPLVAATGERARQTYKERFTTERYADEWRRAVRLDTSRSAHD